MQPDSHLTIKGSVISGNVAEVGAHLLRPTAYHNTFSPVHCFIGQTVASVSTFFPPSELHIRDSLIEGNIVVSRGRVGDVR